MMSHAVPNSVDLIYRRARTGAKVCFGFHSCWSERGPGPLWTSCQGPYWLMGEGVRRVAPR